RLGELCFGTFCFSVSALVIGAPKGERILLPKRVAAFWEGHEKSSMLFQKISWEEPEKQKPRSCRAQELSRSCAQWRGREWREWTELNHIGESGNKSPKGEETRSSARRPTSFWKAGTKSRYEQQGSSNRTALRNAVPVQGNIPNEFPTFWQARSL